MDVRIHAVQLQNIMGTLEPIHLPHVVQPMVWWWLNVWVYYPMNPLWKESLLQVYAKKDQPAPLTTNYPPKNKHISYHQGTFVVDDFPSFFQVGYVFSFPGGSTFSPAQRNLPLGWLTMRKRRNDVWHLKETVDKDHFNGLWLLRDNDSMMVNNPFRRPYFLGVALGWHPYIYYEDIFARQNGDPCMWFFLGA